MLAFVRREADILVSTTIIESGIDVPTANTMIIADADRFGLADLHQLRGRVGRYKHRAYCYMLLPENRTIQEKAVKRLKAIEEFSMLGAGFKIAMRDLEIRGAGNILGPEQSGHIAAVGYEMYCQLLDLAVKHLRGESVAVPSETSIELHVSGLIPKSYIPSDQRRMEAYRRLATATTPEQLAKFRTDLTQAYGEPTPNTQRLIDLVELRIAAANLSVKSIAVREKDVVLRTTDPGSLMALLKPGQGSVRLLPPKAGEEACEVYFRPPDNYMEPETLLRVLRKHLCTAPSRPAAEPAPAARRI
jgi:transcription-repair coupling factor (superfamily II helicase)